MFLEQLIIVEPRRLVGESLRAMIAQEGIFGAVHPFTSSDSWEVFEEKNDRSLFLVSGPSLRTLEKNLVCIRKRSPLSVLVLLEDRFRWGTGLLIRKIAIQGYWTFQDTPEDFLQGLKDAARRRQSLSPLVRERLFHTERGISVNESGSDAPAYSLSRREIQLIQRITEGKKTGQCAEEMNITPKSVANLRDRIMKKWGVHSIGELILKSWEIGFLDPSEF